MTEYRVVCCWAKVWKFSSHANKLKYAEIEDNHSPMPTTPRGIGLNWCRLTSMDEAKKQLRLVRRFCRPLAYNGNRYKCYQWGFHIQSREVTEWEDAN